MQPRLSVAVTVKLKVPGADALENEQIHYKVRDPSRFDGKHLVVLGGGDSALDWALELEPRVSSLTVMHRRAQYRAQPASVSKLEALCDGKRVHALQGFVTGLEMDNERMTGLTCRDAEGNDFSLEADHALVFWGFLIRSRTARDLRSKRSTEERRIMPNTW